MMRWYHWYFAVILFNIAVFTAPATWMKATMLALQILCLGGMVWSGAREWRA